MRARFRKILDTLLSRFQRVLSGARQIGRAGFEESVMYLKKVEGPRAVTLPDGTILSRADLPTQGTCRWVASRKLAVVRGVLYGLLSRDDALTKYDLSEEEFSEWVRAVSLHGEEALKATALKLYRKTDGSGQDE